MNRFNSTQYTHKELACLILIGISGSAAVNILPFIVSAFAHAPDIGLEQASEIASIELLGLSLMGLTHRLWSQYGSPKIQVLLGITLYCLGNLAVMMFSSDYAALNTWRALAGAGAGIASAVAFAAIARQRNPDAIFAILIFFQVLWSALGSLIMPVLMEAISWSAAFAYIAAFGVIALLVSWRWLPELGATNETDREEVYSQDWIARTLIIGSSILWYIALGLFWGESAQTGDEIGASAVLIGIIFSAGYLVSLSGNGIALWLSQRYSRQLPLLLSGAMHGAVYVLFTLSETNANVSTYVIAVLLFSLTWAIFTPFQIGLFSDVKSDGSFATHFLPCSIIGILLGTAIAPWLDNDNKLWLAVGVIPICLALYQLYYLRQQPWQADESSI